MTDREIETTAQRSLPETSYNEMVMTNLTLTSDIQQNSTTAYPLEKLVQFFCRRYGLTLAVITAILFSFQSPFIAILTETLDSIQVVFFARTYFYNMLPPSRAKCTGTSSKRIQTLPLAPWKWFISSWKHLHHPTCPFRFTCRRCSNNIVHSIDSSRFLQLDYLKRTSTIV